MSEKSDDSGDISSSMSLRTIQERGRIRSSTRFSQRGLNLCRQHEQLPASLHDDLTHIPASGGDDLHRFAFRRAANLIAKTSELISLSNPCVPAYAVLLDEIRYRTSGQHRGLQIIGL